MEQFDSPSGHTLWEFYKSTRSLKIYYIKQKFDTLYNQLEEATQKSDLLSIKWKIWHGKSKEAIEQRKLHFDCNSEVLSN